MTVKEFLKMFTEENKQIVCLYDNNKQMTIFKGCLYELSEQLFNATITSIESITLPTTIISLNIDL